MRRNWVRSSFLAGAAEGRRLANLPDHEFAEAIAEHQREHEHGLRRAAGKRGTLTVERERGTRGPVLSAERVAVYQQVLELRSRGLSYARIAARLNRDGVPTVRAAEWGVSSIQMILKSDAARKLRAAADAEPSAEPTHST